MADETICYLILDWRRESVMQVESFEEIRAQCEWRLPDPDAAYKVLASAEDYDDYIEKYTELCENHVCDYASHEHTHTFHEQWQKDSVLQHANTFLWDMTRSGGFPGHAPRREQHARALLRGDV